MTDPRYKKKTLMNLVQMMVGMNQNYKKNQVLIIVILVIVQIKVSNNKTYKSSIIQLNCLLMKNFSLLKNKKVIRKKKRKKNHHNYSLFSKIL